MAIIQIPNLPVAVALTGDELIEAVQFGTSVRLSLSQLSQIFTSFPASIITVNPPVAGSTNVQGALQGLASVDNTKVSKTGDTMTGDLHIGVASAPFSPPLSMDCAYGSAVLYISSSSPTAVSGELSVTDSKGMIGAFGIERNTPPDDTAQFYFASGPNWGATNPTQLMLAGNSSSIVGCFPGWGENAWKINIPDAAPMTGGNAGANFSIQRYNDAGVIIDAPLSIARATALVSLTGNLTLSKSAPQITLNKPAYGTPVQIYGQTNGVSRWNLCLGDGGGETGSNAGSDFSLTAFADNGAPVGQVISIVRATGVATFSAIPNIPATTPTLSTQVVSKGYIDSILGGGGAASQAANTFFAAPNGSAGAPTFRLITAPDLPATITPTNIVGPSTAPLNIYAGTGQPLQLGVNNSQNVWQIDTAGNLKPLADNNRDLGISSTRVRTVYAVNLGAVGTPITNLYATTTSITGALTASPVNANVTFSPTGTGTVTINPATLGHIDNTAIGATTASSGAFTGLSASGTVSGPGFTTLLSPYAPLNSPVFSGTPSLPTGTVGVTQTAGDSSTKLATTAFVGTAITNLGLGTMATQSAANVAITGGTINGASIGATTAAAGTFTNLTATGTVSGAGFTTLLSLYAPLASPTFTGTPSLPTGTVGVTQAAADSSTKLATTAFVKSQNYLTGNQSITLSGDVTGSGTTAIAATVVQLQGRPVSATAPTSGYFLSWNGSAWAPAAPGAAAAGGTNGQIQYNNGGLLGGITQNGSGNVVMTTGATGVSFSVGATITGANAGLIITKAAAGQSNTITGQTNASTRWIERLGDSTAEGGSNAGSDYALERYSDAAALLGTPLKITRSTGIVTFANNPIVNVASGSASITMNVPTGSNTSTLFGQKNAVNRWAINIGDTATETGSNAGCNFSIQPYSDAGGLIGTLPAFQITRSTGAATFNANPTITTTTNASLSINGTANNSSTVFGQKSNNNRWGVVLGDSTVEGGSNAGSDFFIARYADAGTFIDNAVKITRSSGVMALSQMPVITTTGSLSGMYINCATGTNSNIIYSQKGASNRWAVNLTDGATESGSNVGSDFSISRYTDAGAYIDNPLRIVRSTGVVNFGQIPSIPTTTPTTSGQIVSKGFADSTYVPLNGSQMMSGDLTIYKDTPAIVLSKTASGQSAILFGKTNGVTRWGFNVANSLAETGSNVGSDFTLDRYDDSGNFLDSPFQLARSTGLCTLTHAMQINPAAGMSQHIQLKKPASGTDIFITAYTGNNARWAINVASAGPESGGNGGSDFGIARYTDAGAFVEYPMVIMRATGETQFQRLVRLNPISGDAALYLNKSASGLSNVIWGTTNGVNRWAIIPGTNSAETGGNVGADFSIARCSDAGAYTADALTIRRSDGYTNIAGALGVGNGISVTGNISASGSATVSGTGSFGNYVYSPGFMATSGVLWLEPSGAEADISVCDTAGNGGQYRNLRIRGLDGGYGTEVQISSVMVVTNAFNVNGQVDAATCFVGRRGQWGSTGQNFSFWWDGSNEEAWISTTRVGYVSLFSDYRIKKDVAPLPSMWERAKLLKPISYTQKAFIPPSELEKARKKDANDPPMAFHDDDIERWGFVAHELQETLIPSAALGVKDDPTTIQTPNPWTVIATLTKALQEAMARIEALEAKLNA